MTLHTVEYWSYTVFMLAFISFKPKAMVFPTLENSWPRVWALGWGMFNFLCKEEWNQVTSSHVLVCVASWNSSREEEQLQVYLGALAVSTCFQQIKQALPMDTHFVEIAWIFHYSLAFHQTINSKNSYIFHPSTAKNYASLEMNGQGTGRGACYCNSVPLWWGHRYLIWFYPVFGPFSGDLKNQERFIARRFRVIVTPLSRD